MNRKARYAILALFCFAGKSITAQQPAAVITFAYPRAEQEITSRSKVFDRGGVDDTVIERAGAMVLRGDGSLVVVDRGALRLKVLDAKGTVVQTIGRRGSGPGEFQEIWSIASMPAGGLALLDRKLRRVTLLDAGGRLIRTTPIVNSIDERGASTQVVGLADNTFLVGFSEISVQAPQPKPFDFYQQLVRFSNDGRTRGAKGLRLLDRQGFIQAVPRRFGGTAYWDLAFGRLGTVRASGTNILFGDGESWSVDERTVDGTVVRKFVVARETEKLSSAQRRAYESEILGSSRNESSVLYESLIKEMPYPVMIPAYSRFETDSTGQIWINAYPAVGETKALWIRLNMGNRQATAFRMPPRFIARAFSPTHVYGVLTDDDEVEHIQAYRIVK